MKSNRALRVPTGPLADRLLGVLWEPSAEIKAETRCLRTKGGTQKLGLVKLGSRTEAVRADEGKVKGRGRKIQGALEEFSLNKSAWRCEAVRHGVRLPDATRAPELACVGMFRARIAPPKKPPRPCARTTR
ncbi:hypothetical protein EYF80_019569 [Liparis tanakae]|uniref:Uncharacterized protein n=1 Tax=Liparis tanakae TaxID=230148 RepID=A0A4Z2HWY7_9TELE|nr:hypothetical protein EYF80_019569 [Liparis tanakae]